MTDTPPLLRLAGITKRFGALVANDAISLQLDRGEVLALLGENGAGKSTLVSILFGHYTADAGTIEVDGVPLPPGQPRAALAAGIGMVHQHFTLADNLTVLDNVMLGTEPLWAPRSRRAAARAALADAAARFGLAVDPDARVGDLSVGERQRVEILKALVAFGRKRGARLLILDEPTAVLTPQESDALFATLAQMVAQGLAIVFISHKLDEVLRVSDRVAVLRGGRLVAQMPAGEADRASLAEAMVGRAVVRPVRRTDGSAKTPAAIVAATHAAIDAVSTEAAVAKDRATDNVDHPNAPRTFVRPVATVKVSRDELRAALAARQPFIHLPPVLELANATVRGTGPRPLLDGVSLKLRVGEVLAIAGVAGNGQQALAEVLGGGRALDAGTLHLAGQPQAAAVAAWVRAGVARIPEDRQHVGVVGDFAVWENAVLERAAMPPLARAGWLRRGMARQRAQALVEGYDVRGLEAGGLDTRTAALSGGNVQKLILGRALAGDGSDAPPPLIVADQPTWGLDVGAVAHVHQRLLDACAAGSALLLISEDLDEIFALADRIAVIHHGRLGPARRTAEWTLSAIGLAMAGADGAHPADGAPDAP